MVRNFFKLNSKMIENKNCHATGLDKAMAKHPRSYKNDNRLLFLKWDIACQKFWKNFTKS